MPQFVGYEGGLGGSAIVPKPRPEPTFHNSPIDVGDEAIVIEHEFAARTLRMLRLPYVTTHATAGNTSRPDEDELESVVQFSIIIMHYINCSATSNSSNRSLII